MCPESPDSGAMQWGGRIGGGEREMQCSDLVVEWVRQRRGSGAVCLGAVEGVGGRCGGCFDVQLLSCLPSRSDETVRASAKLGMNVLACYKKHHLTTTSAASLRYEEQVSIASNCSIVISTVRRSQEAK